MNRSELPKEPDRMTAAFTIRLDDEMLAKLDALETKRQADLDAAREAGSPRGLSRIMSH